MFQTTTGFLSAENWSRWDGRSPDCLPYRKASEGSTVPQYSFDMPIIGSLFLKSCNPCRNAEDYQNLSLLPRTWKNGMSEEWNIGLNNKFQLFKLFLKLQTSRHEVFLPVSRPLVEL
jgi:hypothetical protein